MKRKQNTSNSSKKSNFEQIGSFSERPVITEIGKESVLFITRDYIQFKDHFSAVKNQMFAPDLDALSFLELGSSSARLFTSFINAGFKSKLITHFANCESDGRPYTDMITNRTLIERALVPQTRASRAEPKQAPSSKHEKTPLDNLYVLKGGMETFHRILTLDPRFIPVLLSGIKAGLCKPTRVDLCLDLSEDIMPYVSRAISTGHYKSYRRHPYGFGWLGGDRIENPVGRTSALFKKFGERQLVLDTVYFGNSDKSKEIAIFYNKRVERRDKADERWGNKSRIEVRILVRDDETEKSALALLDSYLDLTSGWKQRVSIFGETLCRCVVFTTKSRIGSKGKDLVQDEIAPWWRALLGTLSAAAKEGPDEAEVSQIKGLEQSGQDKGLLALESKSPELESFFPQFKKVPAKRGRPKGSKDRVKRKPGSGSHKISK